MNRSAQPSKMKIWLDDCRPMPKDYDVHCFTAQAAIELLRKGVVGKISLDHDLGELSYSGGRPVDPGNGYQVACVIEEMANEGCPRIEVLIHSQNPVGRKKMEEAVAWAQRAWDDQEDERLRETP